VGEVLTIAASVGMTIVLSMAVVFAVFSGRFGSDLADWMLEAGGERKAYYRPLRMTGFGMFAIGLCFSIWFVGRGTGPGATHSQHVAGLIARVFFGVAVTLFVLWWWVSGLKMRDD
jgi:hypothetical protein